VRNGVLSLVEYLLNPMNDDDDDDEWAIWYFNERKNRTIVYFIERKTLHKRSDISMKGRIGQFDVLLKRRKTAWNGLRGNLSIPFNSHRNLGRLNNRLSRTQIGRMDRSISPISCLVDIRNENSLLVIDFDDIAVRHVDFNKNGSAVFSFASPQYQNRLFISQNKFNIFNGFCSTHPFPLKSAPFKRASNSEQNVKATFLHIRKIFW
jgi:hypothetical protein